MASMSELLGPPPGAPPAPPPLLCEGGCGAKVAPFWTAFATNPGWWQPRLCDACSQKKRAEERRAQAERERLQCMRERIARAGLIEGLQNKTFENFQVLPGTQTSFAAARAFASQAVELLPERGLMFVGSNGAGKSHLSAAILHHALDGNHRLTGAFVRFSAYLKKLQQSFDGSQAVGPDDLRATMQSVSVLVLDDIGAAAARSRGWDREELVELLEERAVLRLPLVTSTDLDEAGLTDHLGKRVVSRLYGACRIVPMADGEIEAGDFRRRP